MGKKRRTSTDAKGKGSIGGASGGVSKLGHSMDATARGKGAAGGMRTAATVRRLQMYKQRAKRDSKGKVLKMDLQSRELPSTRIIPDRRSVLVSHADVFWEQNVLVCTSCVHPLGIYFSLSPVEMLEAICLCAMIFNSFHVIYPKH